MERHSVVPYEGEKDYLFISYSHKDSEKILPILERLVKEGYRIWYDEGIDPGSEWPENIAKHLSRSSACIGFISNSYLDSDYCRRELNFSLGRKIPFLSIMLEEVHLTDGVEMQLSNIQAIFKYKLPSDEHFYQKINGTSILQPSRVLPEPPYPPEPPWPPKGKTFPNAALGVKRIFTAEILSLIAAVLSGLIALAAVFIADVSEVAIASSGNAAFSTILAVTQFAVFFAFVNLFLTIIAIFMKLFGVNKANADESFFGIAFALILISLVVFIISVFFSGTTSSVLSIISQIMNLIIAWAIVNGIRNLAVRLSNPAMEAQGKTVFTLLLCSYGLSIIARLISLFAPAFVMVLSVVALILQLVYYVLYLIFLSRAKKMLGA